MFYIDKNTELTTELLSKYIKKYTMNTRHKLQKWKNQYDGNHAILRKTYKDKSKPCNKIVTNFCKIITDTYSGYICGQPIVYNSNDDITDLQEVINYNDSNAEDIRWITNTLIHGVGYELMWLDSEAKIRYSQINPINAFAIFDNTLDCELLYFVRWYDSNSLDDDDSVNIEVYDSNAITIFHAKSLHSQLEFIEQKQHHFGDVPVSVFYLNENETSIFNDIITLNDSYNELQSSEVDDYQAWVDAYLTLTGMDSTSSEDIADMKENRVLLIPEGGSASWLVKNANDTQIQNMLEAIQKNIFKVTACPDMTDENFAGGVSSGISLSYKLTGFENVASSIVARFTKSIQRRIELICHVLNLKASDDVWRDINIQFTRNLPVNITETVALVNSLRGVVSDATLLTQIPFVDDVQAELEALEKQRQTNMALYSFGGVDDGEETE